MNRHVSGSLLPSSSPRILQPIETPFGVLQVRVIPDIDAHGLFRNESLLATHGNGYSCHALAERMIAGDEAKVRDQVAYILACGGTARHVDHVVNSMKVAT